MLTGKHGLGKMKSKVVSHHVNAVRDSRWTLIQEDDGTLHVEQQASYSDGAQHRRVAPINDFMREVGPPPRALQTLIDRMFDDA